MRIEALRHLHARGFELPERELLRSLLESARGDRTCARFADQVAFVLATVGATDASRPAALEAWQDAVAAGGDPDSGRRVSFSAQSSAASAIDSPGRVAGAGPGPGRLRSS